MFREESSPRSSSSTTWATESAWSADTGCSPSAQRPPSATRGGSGPPASHLVLTTESSRLLLLPLITIYQLTGGRRFQDWKLLSWSEALATLVRLWLELGIGPAMIDHQSHINHFSCFPNIAIPLCFNNDWKLNSFSSNDIFIRRSDTPHVLVAPQYLFSPHDGLATLLCKIVEDYHSDAFTSYII